MIVIIATFLLSCNQNNAKAQDAKAIEFTIVDFEGLKPYLNKNDNKTYIINFWATWCAPCIKEMPYFEEITKTHDPSMVEVILVSLDFPKQFETKLKPFIKKNSIQSKVLALDDLNMNHWIPQVDESWSGAIPATIIYNKHKRSFYETSFTKEELNLVLTQFLN